MLVTRGWSRGGARGPFLDQTEARRAEQIYFGDRTPLYKGVDDPPPPLHLISRSGSGTGYKIHILRKIPTEIDFRKTDIHNRTRKCKSEQLTHSIKGICWFYYPQYKRENSLCTQHQGYESRGHRCSGWAGTKVPCAGLVCISSNL